MNRRALLLTIGVVVGLAGCARLKRPAPPLVPAAVGTGAGGAAPQFARARDDSCRVSLPPGWSELPADGRAVLKVGEPTDNALFMVLENRKEDLAAGVTYEWH
jgi:hypothetical protein